MNYLGLPSWETNLDAIEVEVSWLTINMHASIQFQATLFHHHVLLFAVISIEHQLCQNNIFTVPSTVAEMYTRFKAKQEITLWHHAQKGSEETSVASDKQRSARRHLLPTDKAPESKQQTCAEKLAVVEELRTCRKHGTAFSTEQLNVWAHMMHIGKYSSSEEPPNVPYFKRGRTKMSSPQSANELPTPMSPTCTSPMSPTK